MVASAVLLLAMACSGRPGPPVFDDVSTRLQSSTVRQSPMRPYGGFWVDLDDDGWLDLVFMNHGDDPSLFHNQQGEHFADVLRQSNIERPAETVHWVAWGTVPDTVAESSAYATVSGTAAGRFRNVPFGGGSSEPPCVVGAAQTSHDLDPVALRYRDLGPHGLALRIEEERSADDETNHREEAVGLVLLPCGVAQPPIETGTVRISSRWTRVMLRGSFDDPIVVAGPPSAEGTDPGVVRIRNIDRSSFEIRFQEWDYLDDRHRDETVAYLAVERGAWSVAGYPIEAGSVETAKVIPESYAGTRRELTRAFTQPPVIVTSVVTANSGDTLTTRLDQVEATGFEIRLQRQQLTDWVYRQHKDRHGGGCTDFDNDGRVDLSFVRGAARGETLGRKTDQLYRQIESLRFLNVTADAGTANTFGRARTPTWVDVDNDGWLDLYVINFSTPNLLYRNRGDGSFEDLSGSSGLDFVDGIHGTWADYDGDGWQDLLLVGPSIRLLRNRGSLHFEDVTAASGLEARPRSSLVAASWGDFDADGYPDVFLASYRPASSTILRNDEGTFRAVPGAYAPEAAQEITGVVWGDLDNDGDLDVILGTDSSLAWIENRGPEGFTLRPLGTDVAVEPGKGGEIALGDYDRDGHLDLAINGENGHRLLRQRPGRASWLLLDFEGTASNRLGFGATVEIRLPDGSRTRRQYTGTGGSWSSPGCAPLHVGLGRAREVDLLVRWPSGAEQTLENVPTRRQILIREPGERDGRPSQR